MRVSVFECLSCSGMTSSHFFNYQSSTKNLCGGSLRQHKYDGNLRVCTARNKSLLDGVLKIVISNNSSSQRDLPSGLVKEKYLAYIWGNLYTLSLLSLWS